MSQFHFDLDTYLDLMRAEVPAYGRLQEAVATAADEGGDGRAVTSVTPLTSDHDRPSTLAEQLGWLADAGLDATAVSSERDLVVVRADRSG
jgi:hypothetical protein